MADVLVTPLIVLSTLWWLLLLWALRLTWALISLLVSSLSCGGVAILSGRRLVEGELG